MAKMNDLKILSILPCLHINSSTISNLIFRTPCYQGKNSLAVRKGDSGSGNGTYSTVNEQFASWEGL